MARQWPTLDEMRDRYAESGIELARKHPACRGKVRFALGSMRIGRSRR